MENEQAKELFTMIAVAYPNFLNDEKKSYEAADKAKFWRSQLMQMEYKSTKRNLERYIRSNPFEPKISDIAAYEEVKEKTWQEKMKEEGLI